MVYQAGVVTTNPKYNTPAAIAAARSGGSASLRKVPAAALTSPRLPVTEALKVAASTPIYQETRPTSGWSNVLDTFTAPWRGKPTYVRGTNNNAAIGAAVSAVTGISTIGAGSWAIAPKVAIGGVAAARALGGAGAIGGAGALRTAAIAGGVGLGAGLLFGGGSKQQQAQDQQQGTTGTSTPSQDTTHIDRSVRNVNTYQDQFTYNQIMNSPGATLGGSPSQSAAADLPSSVSLIPTQSAPFSQEPSQSAAQSATASASWLIPALIVGAALIYSKR